jgi:hypothetical protein
MPMHRYVGVGDLHCIFEDIYEGYQNVVVEHMKVLIICYLCIECQQHGRYKTNFYSISFLYMTSPPAG